MFASLCSIPAFAEGAAETDTPAKSYPAAPMTLRDALAAGNRTAVMMALKSDLGSIGVIVDIKTFNAFVIYPINEYRLSYKFGTFSGKAPDASAVLTPRENRSFFFNHKINETNYYGHTIDLGNVETVSYAPPVEEEQLNPNIFFRPEPGYYEINGGVCSVCATYFKYPQPEKHMLMGCKQHYVCRSEAEGTLPHYSVCTDCGLPMCYCFCLQSANDFFYFPINGSGDFVAAGYIPECITLGFEPGAKVTYLNEGAKPALSDIPNVSCSDCGKTMPICESVMFNCGAHYFCPDCAKKLSVDVIRTHRDILECNHYSCDGYTHSTEVISEYCPWKQGKHRMCEGYEAVHLCGGCGQVYNCEDSIIHTPCYVCYQPLCVGEHIYCEYCGGKFCDHNLHGPGACNRK